MCDISFSVVLHFVVVVCCVVFALSVELRLVWLRCCVVLNVVGAVFGLWLSVLCCEHMCLYCFCVVLT